MRQQLAQRKPVRRFKAWLIWFMIMLLNLLRMLLSRLGTMFLEAVNLSLIRQQYPQIKVSLLITQMFRKTKRIPAWQICQMKKLIDSQRINHFRQPSDRDMSLNKKQGVKEISKKDKITIGVIKRGRRNLAVRPKIREKVLVILKMQIKALIIPKIIIQNLEIIRTQKIPDNIRLELDIKNE